MDFSSLIAASLLADEGVRRSAEQQLQQLMNTDFKQYMLLLAAEAHDESKAPHSRQLAALTLKNAVTPRTGTSATLEEREQMALRWYSLPEDVKLAIKNRLFETLASPVSIAQSATTIALAHLASIELPRGHWPELMPAILGHIANSASSPAVVAAAATDPTAPARFERLRAAAFELLGYVCEAVPSHLTPHATNVLNAISFGLAATETNLTIRLAATRALCNSMDFIGTFFERADQRGVIMTMVFSSCESTDLQVRIAGFECLIEIAAVYYPYLDEYMGRVFELTAGAINAQSEGVDSLAIEFWTTIAEVEFELLENEKADDADEPAVGGGGGAAAGAGSPSKCLKLSARAAGPLTPMLLEALKRQNEDPDDETNTVAVPAALCLSSYAAVCQESIIQPVLEFVQKNLGSADWHAQEAAIMALAAVLRCEHPEPLRVLVSHAIPYLLDLCNVAATDASKVHPHVHDTALWSIGRIAENVSDFLDPFIEPTVNVLGRSLTLPPRLAQHSAWALINLGEAVSSDVNGDESAPNVLTPHLPALLQALFACAERPDAQQHNLLIASYEAMSALIASAAAPSFGLIAQLAQALLERLKRLQPSTVADASQREAQAAVQAQLCGCLQAVVERVSDEAVQMLARPLGETLAQLLTTRSNTVSEEALMVAGALALRMGSQFDQLMPLLQDKVLAALRTSSEPSLCSVALGTVGEIMRALDNAVVVHFGAFCNDVMNTLLQLALATTVDKSVKPLVLSTIGDVALAMGSSFEPFLPHVFRLFSEATSIALGASLDEDYAEALRIALVEGYTGVFQGVASINVGAGPGAQQQNAAYSFVRTYEGSSEPPLAHVARLVLVVASNDDSSDELTRSTLSLFCDLLAAAPRAVEPLVAPQAVRMLVRRWPSEHEDDSFTYVRQTLRQSSYGSALA